MSQLLINEDALKSNIEALRSIDKSVELGVCIKADGYSHTASKLINSINGDVKYIFVGTPEEAFTLNQDPSFRNNNQTIMVLYTFTKDDLMRLANHPNVVFNICDEYGLQLALDYCFLINQGLTRDQCQKVRFTLNIDTGMHFLGFEPDRFDFLVNCLIEAQNVLEIFCVSTHFATADSDGDYYFQQFDLFDYAINYLLKRGIEFKAVSYHNSASLLTFPLRSKTKRLIGLGEKFNKIDIARAGIAVYGYYPSRQIAGVEGVVKLTPILSWISQVASLKTLIPGSTIGYGCNYKTPLSKYTTIAIVPVGYYEGFSRRLSNKGTVVINGAYCNVVGNVRMNQIAVDVTNVVVNIGDKVVIIDTDRTADDLAIGCDTINYEILTNIKG